MTVSSATVTTTRSWTSGGGNVATGLQAIAAEHIVVRWTSGTTTTTLTRGVHYSISLDASRNATLVPIAMPASGTLTFTRVTPVTQGTVFLNGTFAASVHEAAHDAHVMRLAEALNGMTPFSGDRDRLSVGGDGLSNWTIFAKAQTTDSTSFPLVVQNSAGGELMTVRADGAMFLKGPITIGPALAGAGPVQPVRHVYIQDVDTDTDNTKGHTAIETRHDAQPATDSACNYDGGYFTLWLSTGVNFTGQPAAVRGNAYVRAPASGTIFVDQLNGVYGRVRNESAGELRWGAALIADGAHNVGGGTITHNIGLRINAQTVGTNNYGVWFANEPNQGSLRADANVSLASKVTGTGTHKFITDGGTVTINAAGQIRNTVQGNLLGQAAGSASSPTAATTNLLLYYNSNTNYAGLSCDTSGNVYLVSGTTSPATRLSISVDTGALRLWGYGSGTLTTDGSGNVTASSDIDLKDLRGKFSKGLETLVQLYPAVYRWNELSGLDRTRDYVGPVIDDNFERALPEAVGRDPQGYRTLNDRPMWAAALNAFRQIDKRLAQLEAA